MTENERTLLEKGCAQLESRAGLVWGPEFIEEFSAAIRSALAEIDALKSDANLVSLNAVNAALAAEVAALKAERDVARRRLYLIINEINCRVEHGADSNGHLEGILSLIEAEVQP